MTQVREKRIGFIGLGSMGKHMATNILKAKFPLTVYDVRKEVLAEMEKLGAKIARSAKELGQECDTVVVMLRNHPQIKEVVFPPEGALGGMQNGSTLIIMSTISPPEVEEVDKVARQSGVSVIDSPVSGGREGAQKGSLVLMAGAEKEVFKENESLLRAMGRHVYYTGGVGTGQTVKMINQILVNAHQIVTAEALAIAKKLGMDLNVLHDIISNSIGDSAVWRMFGPRMITRDFEPRGTVNIMVKDSRSIMQTAVNLDIPIFISAIPYQVSRIAESRGLGEKDVASLITIFEEYAGGGTNG